MIKYKIGFAISAETLFGLLGKLLPIEDLEVEELIALEPKPKPAHRLEHAKPKRHRDRGPNLEAGVNQIIMQALAGGPKRAVDLKAVVQAGGYASTGIGSRLERLRHHKIIHRPKPGVYEIANDPHVQTRRPQGGPVREFA